jgi:hypothetical protein
LVAKHFQTASTGTVHPSLEGGDGTALAGLLERFKPATEEDRVLLKALFLSPFWGGPYGQRPAWLIASDEDGTGAADGGRGTGKTTLARMVGRLAGGAIAFDRGEQVRDIQTRLLSPGAAGKRIALLDNVKSHSFSWAELEALITADTISGRKLFVGDGARPNGLTWLLTINGAIRSWTGLSISLASVVRTVQVRSAPSGPCQRSHRPANAIGCPSRRRKWYGRFVFPTRCHS